MSALFAVAGFGATHPAIAGEVGRLFVFGDSSADVGTDGKRYTNKGEMWTESVARFLGRTSTPARGVTLDTDGNIDRSVPVRRLTGANYAVGGATAAPLLRNPAAGASVEFAEQVGYFRQDHPNGFAKNDLTLVWMGGNDAANALLSGLAHDSQRYADAYMRQISALRSAGARNIVAVNEPSSLLPVRYYQDLLELETEEITALMGAHSANINADNAALRQRQVAEGVYVLDLDRLAHDILARPARYGFTSTIDSYMTLGDPRDLPNDGNLFADNHYSSAMQAVIADFALAQMQARDRFAALATLPLDMQRHLDASMAKHMTGAASGASPVGSVSLTTSADLSRHDIRALGTDPGYRRDGASVDLGLEWRADQNATIGLLARWHEAQTDIPKDRGGYDSRTLSATLYGLVQPTKGLTISLALSGGKIDHDDIKRPVPLGSQAVETAMGQTEALFGSVRLGAAYEYAFAAGLSLTPAIHVSATRATTDGYQEAAGPISLHYGKATLDEVRVGGALTLAFRDRTRLLQPSISVGIDHVVHGQDVTVDVGPTADMLVPFRSDRRARTFAHADAGLDLVLAPQTRIRMNVGAERQIWGDADTKLQPRARLGVSIGF